MKTQVVFYSYTGNAKHLARVLSTNEGLEVSEIKDVKTPGKIKAYSLGCFAAMRGKPWGILPLEADLSACDRIILFSPVWAGNPPPAVYAFLEKLPEGKAVSVKMVSASGVSKCKERLEELLSAKGCTLEGFEDIKA